MAEIAGNLIVPGLGGLLFGKEDRRKAVWQILLSVAGLGLAMFGAGLFTRVFLGEGRWVVDESSVARVINEPGLQRQLFFGLGAVVLGGILILGGFLWSLETAMRRWKGPKEPGHGINKEAK